MVVASSGKKIDLSKQGLNSVQDPTVKLNLRGESKTMLSKDWVDPQGRKGKVRGTVGPGGGCAAGRPAGEQSGPPGVPACGALAAAA